MSNKSVMTYKEECDSLRIENESLRQQLAEAMEKMIEREDVVAEQNVIIAELTAQLEVAKAREERELVAVLRSVVDQVDPILKSNGYGYVGSIENARRLLSFIEESKS